MALGQDRGVWGELKVSAAEQAEYEAELFAKRVCEIPSNLQFRADYLLTTDGLPAYIGYAPRGLAEGDIGWMLKKFTYDASRQCTKIQIAYAAWDDRADGGTVYS